MMIKRPHGDAVFFDYKKLFFFKCSTRSISKSRRDYGQSAVLELFVRKNKQKLATIAHPDPRGGKSRQKLSKMSEICLPTRPKSVRAEAKVDKNRAKCLKFVYRPPKNGPRIPESRPKNWKNSLSGRQN